MAQPQKHPLRALSEQEERELRRIVKASSERIDVARRARALLAVATKQSFPQAASVAGFAEARSVSEVVERFNEHGLTALSIAAGRGRQDTLTKEEQGALPGHGATRPAREGEPS